MSMNLVKIGELGDVYNGNSINEDVKAKKYAGVESGTPYISTKDVKFDTTVDYENGIKIPQEDISKFKIAKAGSAIICAEGGSAGRKIALLTEDVCFGNKLFAFTSSSKLLNKYVYYYFFSPQFKKAFADSLGGIIGGVSMNKFKEIMVPILSEEEQERIVQKLEVQMAGIQQLEKSTLRQIDLASEMLIAKIDEIMNSLAEVSNEVQLQDVLAEQPRNGWSPPSANHSDEGTPVLTLSSVTGFIFREDKIKFTNAAIDQSKHYWVKDGDLLITRSNTPELVGHVAVASNIEEPTIYPDLIMRMIPDERKADVHFLYYQLRSSKLRKIITSRAKGANPTMKKISKSDVQTLPIVLPDLLKQKESVKRLNEISSQLNQLAQIYDTKVKKLNDFKNQILKEAYLRH